MLSPSLAFITSVPLSFFFLFNAFFPVWNHMYLFTVDILPDVNLGFLSSGAFFMIL